ncbi:phosphoribosylamine--glycine ligase [Nanchangia anserum]|uniref:Phosphoribosylamine--glycine ligase n=1 Tax=Nanchangia anserum TaxID=2692125 RepID=A0A8I0GDG4_9ACTO|nr:phosphoribosylamine--glycine ligase [Nanchangia anserum]MBD3689523.1 phosphoribosylamine--glycine ligase [Nanchangia anserum]QOX81713.1 phosphoribosylamine--glycine ligase [Nanchangia anserum]
MKTLILGSGGREGALVRALSVTTARSDLFAAPGNPGMRDVATLIDLDPLDADAVAAWCGEHDIDLCVIGPEAPLVAGVADTVRAAGIACFGPSRAAARLEASKAFAKDVMESAGVATAACLVCRSEDEVAAALDRFGAPYVVKDDGLAAGKGVVVTEDRDGALAHGRACVAGDGQVVVEEFLDGPEVSLFCLCDGHTVVPLSPAQDFKRVFDGQRGPNTGGMGAYAPLSWIDADLVDRVVAEVAEPVVAEMARRGTPFTGLLYCGLALTSRGVRVVEFNVRFGDPETQVVLPLEGERVGELLWRAATGTLADAPARGDNTPGAAVTVVITNEGYPGPLTRPGEVIGGLDEAAQVEGVYVIHAGTAERDGEIIATGGRVLNIVATGDTLEQARERAYRAVAAIDVPGSHYRGDIARVQAEA